MIRVLITCTALAGTLLAAVPGPAEAASVGRYPEVGFERTPLSFRALPGEANRVTVSSISGSDYRVEDRGAPLAAGPGCSQTPDFRVVVCGRAAAGESPGIDAQLGDRDDVIQLSISDGAARGGPGDDRLSGGSHSDRLEGGRGNDVLFGGGGADTLQGDTGADDLRGGRGHDALAGGPGADRLIGDSGNDALFPNTFIFFFIAQPGEPGLPPGGDEENTGTRATDLLSGGRGLDVAAYRVEGRRSAPKLAVTFDGRADDGPRGERDNAARGLERVYSFASGRRCRRLGRPRRRICSFGTFEITPRPGPNGERLRPSGAFSLRIYRLSRRGTARAASALFETQVTGGVRVSEGRSRKAPTEITLPKSGFRSCRTTAGAARHRSRRIINRFRARTRGPRFRGRGRYSAATVRGTDWTVADRCDGTLTKVRRGSVVVRDLRRRKTIVLGAGESYLARAP